jgi:hypothetical protein
MLPVTRCFWVNWGRDRKLLAVIDEHDAVLLRPTQNRSGGFLVLEPHPNQPFPGAQLVE